MRAILTERFVPHPAASDRRAQAVFAAALLAVALSGLEPAFGQPAEPAPTGARAAASADFLDSFTWHPGGTREADMWQVLILFGVGDPAGESWDGSLAIQGGEVLAIEPHRQEPPDRILPQGGWTLRTQAVRLMLQSTVVPQPTPSYREAVLAKGLWVRGSGGTGTVVSVTTDQGDFSFRPASMEFGPWAAALGGRVRMQRTPPATDLSGTELRQHDSPAVAADSAGTLFATWYSYHDRREELNFRRYHEGRWSRLIPVGRAAEDLWRPQIAVDGDDKPWLIYSQRPPADGPGNWDIYAMAWEDDEWGRQHRLTDSPLPDIEPHVARAPDGTVYVVWQAMAGRHSQIRLKHLRDGRWSETVVVTRAAANDWSPSVAAGPNGEAWIAWDRYTQGSQGSYDVRARSYSPNDGLGPEMAVASTSRFEAHASVAVDARGRPWIAWETSGVNWGKDLGRGLGDRQPGTPLGAARRIEVACLDGGRWQAPAEVAFDDPLAAGSTGESRPLLRFDPDGNLWMAFKRRYSRRSYRPTSYWESFLTRLEGGRWTEPAVLPSSWARKSTRMGLAFAEGRLWAFWPHESRRWSFASRPRLNRVVAGSLPLPGPAAAPRLRPYRPEPGEARPDSHPAEADDVRFIRGYRVEHGGEALRIVRGDLHRHTELSQDVGGVDDGSLPEFYRYMIDAAEMDFGASTDHQAGGTDFWNAMTQKLADMYHFPERFSTLYGYERNPGNPFGHRNLIYTHRDYPIVPFFIPAHPRFLLPDSPDGELLTFSSMGFGSGVRNETKLLYEVARRTGGLAIPHTSGTDSMGTDWRDNDPEVDVVAEIYQGARQSYEHKNAPRGIRDGEEGEAAGGFQEPGMLWNAWSKGYRIGVIASSDHYSTHISYAMVYTPDTSREAIHDAIRRRRTYGATDNIVLEFRMGSAFMGEELAADGPQRVLVRARGTDSIAAVHVIRDGAYVYRVAPGTPEAEFEFLDVDAPDGEHWYYVRVEQEDGEIAWSSPIWIDQGR